MWPEEVTVHAGFNCSYSTSTMGCNTVLYTSITSIRPDGGADSREERENISCAVRRGWQWGQVEKPAWFAMDCPSQRRGWFNWTGQPPSPSLIPNSYIALSFSLFPSLFCISIYYSTSVPPIVRLKCKNCLHVPRRAEAGSWKTPMWETGNSSSHNTQHSFVRSTTTCDVLIFLSAGC